MLKRPVDAEIGLYRVEPGIPDVEVELERVALKDTDPIVGGTVECDSDIVVAGRIKSG